MNLNVNEHISSPNGASSMSTTMTSSSYTPRMLSQQDFNRHRFASMKANVLTQLPIGKSVHNHYY